jgi:microcystin degradation protein MlrC
MALNSTGRRRILVVGVKQETATFNPASTTLDDFECVHGREAVAALTGTATEVGGILDAAAHHDVTVGTVAWAPSGGAVDKSAWAHLRESILDDVATGPFAAILVVLHGAMVCVDSDDPEGQLLGDIAELVGDVPIVATLDLHAVLTDDMLARADVFVPFHTYPHVDHHSTGVRAVRALDRLLGGAVPTTAYTPVPALVRGDELLTDTGLLGRMIGTCRTAEASGALSSAIIIGNPFTDVDGLRSGVLVTTVDDLESAKAISSSVAGELWAQRRRFRADLVDVRSAVAASLDAIGGPVILADQADATSSGAAGDAVTILEALLALPGARPAMVSVVDAPAAAQACAVGVGATASFRLGGIVDPRHAPITVEATVVRADLDQTFLYEDGTVARPGPSALLRVDGVDVVVTSKAIWVVGQNIYRAFGLDPRRGGVVVVKSPNGYRPHYESIASRMISVDGDGATSAALERLPYVKLRRPTWPLDDDFEPELSPMCFVGRRPV